MDLDSSKFTGFKTDSAFDTETRIDLVRGTPFAADGLDWTLAGASGTSDTLVDINRVSYQALTLTCGTFLLDYMGKIFVFKILDGRENRVWCGLSECAQGSFFHRVTDLGHLIQIIESSVALRNLFKNIG